VNVTLTGGTSQQRQWFEEAVREAGTYPFDKLTVNVTVSWVDEPPCPGHKETACTTTADGVNFELKIRNTLDTFGRLFYDEIVVHELGHVISFALTTVAERQTMCAWFHKHVPGEGDVPGTAADLNPLDQPWEDRIQEAMAETVKDAIMPDRYREADNRTNWEIDRDRYEDFMTAMMPPDVTGTERILGWSTPGAPGDVHLPPEFFGDAGLVIVVDPTSVLNSGDGGTFTFRFRWAASTNAYQGFYDFEVPLPANMNYRLYAIFLEPDTGGGIAVVDFFYASWPEGGTEAEGVAVQLGAGGGPSFDFSWWAQWSLILPPVPGAPPPPYPYRDPLLAGGGGDTQVFRFA
jgi:hypothetical protein